MTNDTAFTTRKGHNNPGRLGLPPELPSATADAPRAAALVERLVADHGAAMHAYARRLCGDPMIAQDLVQEAMLRAWRHWDRLEDKYGSVRGWLLTVLRNLDVDRRRAVGARPKEVGIVDAPGPVDTYQESSSAIELHDVENRIVLKELLSHLSDGERAVLVEVYLRDQTVEQAANTLGLPVGTVKSRTFYALRRLRDLSSTREAAA